MRRYTACIETEIQLAHADLLKLNDDLDRLKSAEFKALETRRDQVAGYICLLSQIRKSVNSGTTEKAKDPNSAT